MKNSFSAFALVAFLLLSPIPVIARHIARPHPNHNHHPQASIARAEDGRTAKPAFYPETRQVRPRRPDTVQVAGSRLPDCSHACGSCTPCRLVMVSFVCASLEEAETCPMAYKCMCNSKAYPVP